MDRGLFRPHSSPGAAKSLFFHACPPTTVYLTIRVAASIGSTSPWQHHIHDFRSGRTTPAEAAKRGPHGRTGPALRQPARRMAVAHLARSAPVSDRDFLPTLRDEPRWPLEKMGSDKMSSYKYRKPYEPIDGRRLAWSLVLW